MPAQLVITMDETTNQLNISGTVPLTNKLLIYGMLDVARDAVREFNAQNASRIVPATIVPMVPRNGG